MPNVPNLDWVYDVDFLDGRSEIKGTVLAHAYWPGTHSRFLVEDVRTREPHPTRRGETVGGSRYRLRDAATVSDADIRAGKRSQVVASGTLEELAAYIDTAT